MEDFSHAFSKRELTRLKKWSVSGGLYMTTNRAVELGNLTCNQIPSRLSKCRSFCWVACKCSAKYKAQTPPFCPFQSSRKSFIPLISNAEPGTVLSKCVLVIAIISNLHKSCQHLSSSILFLKLQIFKWATLKSFARKLRRCWVRSARWLSPSSPLWIALSVLSPSCPSSIGRKDSSDTDVNGRAESKSSTGNAGCVRHQGHFLIFASLFKI